jgi:hypothetical protein
MLIRANQENVMNANQPKCRTAEHIGLALAVICATMSFSTASFAVGTAQQRATCTGDVMRLCFASIGSDRAIIDCMTRNKDRLSWSCKKMLLPI